MRILIIDDDEVARFLLSDILEPYNCEIVAAKNCLVGYEILRSQPKFDLALVDWNTPEMTGINFVKNVRANPALIDLIVIMTTGMSDIDCIKQALAYGANEYVMKPFTEDMVLEKIRMTGIKLS